MTSKNNNQSCGLPAPITKLTVEQDLRLRLLHDKLQESYHERKDDVITLMMALQQQSFVLGNSLTNLVKQWPTQTVQSTTNEDPPMFGILLETKD